MDEFERARLKTEKRDRKTLHMPAPIVTEPSAMVEIVAPKEKRPSIDAVITVTVTLPYEMFSLTFTRPNVLGMKKLTKQDFQRAIGEGLKTILGTVR